MQDKLQSKPFLKLFGRRRKRPDKGNLESVWAVHLSVGIRCGETPTRSGETPLGPCVVLVGKVHLSANAERSIFGGVRKYPLV